jgi:hypothetical protein
MYHKAIATFRKLSLLSTSGSIATDLIFPSFIGNKASFIYNGSSYKIEPTSIFLSKIIVSKGNNQIAELELDWKMTGTLRMENLDGMTKLFTFKGGSLLHKKYLLTDYLGNNMLSILPSWNWSRFNYDYTITEEDGLADQENNIELPLLTIICTYGALLMSKKRRRRKNA